MHPDPPNLGTCTRRESALGPRTEQQARHCLRIDAGQGRRRRRIAVLRSAPPRCRALTGWHVSGVARRRRGAGAFGNRLQRADDGDESETHGRHREPMCRRLSRCNDTTRSRLVPWTCLPTAFALILTPGEDERKPTDCCPWALSTLFVRFEHAVRGLLGIFSRKIIPRNTAPFIPNRMSTSSRTSLPSGRGRRCSRPGARPAGSGGRKRE